MQFRLASLRPGGHPGVAFLIWVAESRAVCSGPGRATRYDNGTAKGTLYHMSPPLELALAIMESNERCPFQVRHAGG